MHSPKFTIALDTPSEGIFRGGCNVTGSVKYILDTPTMFKYIQISFIGPSKCISVPLSFMGKVGKWGQISGTDDAELDKKLVNETVPLLENSDNMLPGAYEHRFHFHLPVDSPPTFKLDDDVKTKYFLRLKVKQNCFLSRVKTVEREILVYGNYGIVLRTLPASRSRAFVIETHLSEPDSTVPNTIKVLAYVDKSFVTPGEFIFLKFLVMNFTDVPITCIKTKIVRKTTIRVEQYLVHQTFSRTKKWFEVNTPSIPQRTVIELGSYVQAMPQHYSIPKTKDRQAIAVHYFLNVTIKLPLPHKSGSIDIPIVVGVKPGDEDLGVIDFDDLKDIVRADKLNVAKRANSFF